MEIKNYRRDSGKKDEYGEEKLIFDYNKYMRLSRDPKALQPEKGKVTLGSNGGLDVTLTTIALALLSAISILICADGCNEKQIPPKKETPSKQNSQLQNSQLQKGVYQFTQAELSNLFLRDKK